jgi:hypothetical protein
MVPSSPGCPFLQFAFFLPEAVRGDQPQKLTFMNGSGPWKVCLAFITSMPIEVSLPTKFS